MNLFNRVVMIVLIPLAGLAFTVLCVFPNELWRVLVNFVQAYGHLELVSDMRLFLLLPALAVDFALLLLFLFEIRRAPQRMIRVRRAAGGEVRLPVESIADQLAYYVDQVNGVIDVKPKVGERGAGVTVSMVVFTAPDVDVPAKADEIIHATHWVIREKMGLTLAGEPKVELRVAPYPRLNAQDVRVASPAPSNNTPGTPTA